MRLSIRELERASGLARRTIHFYTRQGVLPSPSGAGPSARYGEEHLLRLRLVPVLKQAGWRLESISRLFDRLDLAQLRCLAERAARLDVADPRRLAHWLLAATGADGEPAEGTARGRQARGRSGAGHGAGRGPSRWVRRWVRVRVARGVEIHYRADTDEDLGARVAELERFARRLFAGGPSLNE